MNGLLALSSLHFALQNPSVRWEYIEIAIQYQNSGLRDYKNALETITDNNSHALFAFSIIITILAPAFLRVGPQPSDSSRSAVIVSIVELLKGVRFVNQAIGSSLRHGKFRGLFRPSARYTHYVLRDEVARPLLKLRELADSIDVSTESERHQAYLSGIDSLQETFKCMESSRHLGPVVAWPATVNRELLRLFRQGNCMAELIFVYYGVLLLHARDQWWAKNVGVRLSSTVR